MSAVKSLLRLQFISNQHWTCQVFECGRAMAEYRWMWRIERAVRWIHWYYVFYLENGNESSEKYCIFLDSRKPSSSASTSVDIVKWRIILKISNLSYRINIFGFQSRGPLRSMNSCSSPGKETIEIYFRPGNAVIDTTGTQKRKKYEWLIWISA